MNGQAEEGDQWRHATGNRLRASGTAQSGMARAAGWESARWHTNHSACGAARPWRAGPNPARRRDQSGGGSSRKYASTAPLSFIVSGAPCRSTVLPTATRTQPSLTQYSSTLVFSTPLNRIPTPRSSRTASWCGLLGLLERRSGGVSVMGPAFVGRWGRWRCPRHTSQRAGDQPWRITVHPVRRQAVGGVLVSAGRAGVPVPLAIAHASASSVRQCRVGANPSLSRALLLSYNPAVGSFR